MTTTSANAKPTTGDLLDMLQRLGFTPNDEASFDASHTYRAEIFDSAHVGEHNSLRVVIHTDDDNSIDLYAFDNFGCNEWHVMLGNGTPTAIVEATITAGLAAVAAMPIRPRTFPRRSAR